MWYWEYVVEIYNEETKKKEVVSGLLAAEDTLVSAAAALDSYYGEELTNVLTLKAITDGSAFEFDLISKDPDYDFDFNITRKEK